MFYLNDQLAMCRMHLVFQPTVFGGQSMHSNKRVWKMEQGTLGGKVVARVPERWITQIENGVVTLVQRIDADAFVVRAQDLPVIAANEEIVSDPLARDILRAIAKRKKVGCGSVELPLLLVKTV